MATPEGEVPDSEKTPVTVVTGFLGAGKTTLVNHILREQRDWRIAIIENEFGAVNIDEGLVMENIAAKEDVVSMDNGCICCSVRGDLVRALNNLIPRRKDFHAILLETTGLADPAPIIMTFNSDAMIQDNFRIDSIVCMVDSKNVHQHLREVRPDDTPNEAVQQVAFADRIILNKLDLVSKEELDALKEEIRSINAEARLIETERSVVDLGLILNQMAFSLDKTLEIDPTLLDEDDDEEQAEEGAGGAQAASSGEAQGDTASDPPKRRKKRHDLSSVSSVGLKFTGNFDVPKFNMFMSTLLQAKAADIYRSKGVLSFEGQGDTKFVFHGVHETINFGPSSKPWGKDEERENKIVFIGRNLNRDELRAGLTECLAKPAAGAPAEAAPTSSA